MNECYKAELDDDCMLCPYFRSCVTKRKKQMEDK